MKILEYLDRKEASPFAVWFASIEARDASEVTIALGRVSAGNLSNVEGVGHGLQDRLTEQG